MYKILSSYWKENYVVDIPVNAANLLTDEEFLQYEGLYYGEGITGYRIELVDEEEDTWKLTIQYVESSDLNKFLESEYFIIKVVSIDSFGVHRGG